MTLRTVIVDDDGRCREYLSRLINEFCPYVAVAGQATSVTEAVALIRAQQPQLLFLDVELGEGTGFDVLQHFTEPAFHTVFTTAYDHYAIKAIRCSALDYLLKPVDASELQKAVAKAKEESNTSRQTVAMLLENLRKPAGADYSITLATFEGFEFVPLQNIIRLEASGPYTHFFLKEGKKITVSKHLKEYEALLADHQFFRVHNSHIINLKEVKRMLKTDGGYAVMTDDSRISISPKKRDHFFQQMGQRLV